MRSGYILFLMVLLTIVGCNKDETETTDEEILIISMPERVASFGPNGTH